MKSVTSKFGYSTVRVYSQRANVFFHLPDETASLILLIRKASLSHTVIVPPTKSFQFDLFFLIIFLRFRLSYTVETEFVGYHNIRYQFFLDSFFCHKVYWTYSWKFAETIKSNGKCNTGEDEPKEPTLIILQTIILYLTELITQQKGGLSGEWPFKYWEKLIFVTWEFIGP